MRGARDLAPALVSFRQSRATRAQVQVVPAVARLDSLVSAARLPRVVFDPPKFARRNQSRTQDRSSCDICTPSWYTLGGSSRDSAEAMVLNLVVDEQRVDTELC